MSTLRERARAVRLALFDVDGVLTDGRLIFGDDGQQYKAFDTRDGHGLKMLMQSGVQVGVITGRQSTVVERRCRELGIEHLYQGREAKVATFESVLADLGLEPGQASYMGDDLPDLPVMLRAGLALTVPEAPAVIKRHAHWVTNEPGGRGAVRSVCELIMDAQETLEPALARYLD